MTDKTFIRITNKDVFNMFETMKKIGEERHLEIISRLDKTNGKVILNTWRSILSLTLSLSVILGLLGVKFL